MSNHTSIQLSKQIRFCASHYYWLESWSEAQNWSRFKGCANRHGHGHNYQVALTVQGPIDPQTGFMINFVDLTEILQTHVVAVLDHKMLNAQVPFFQDYLPTLESITYFVAQQLLSPLKEAGLSLISVKTLELDDLFMVYSIPPAASQPLTEAIMRLTRQYNFSAAHRLWNPSLSEAENQRLFGPCTRIHGHNYMLEITLEGRPDPLTSMIVDIEAFDTLVEQVLLADLDHRFLDEELSWLGGKLSTAEHLAQGCFDRLAPKIESLSPEARLVQLRLYENPTHWVDVMTEQPLRDHQPLLSSAASTLS